MILKKMWGTHSLQFNRDENWVLMTPLHGHDFLDGMQHEEMGRSAYFGLFIANHKMITDLSVPQ